jgi:hypothetical protein
MKDVPKAIEAMWKIEFTRLFAAIDRVTHDIGIKILRERDWREQSPLPRTTHRARNITNHSRYASPHSDQLLCTTQTMLRESRRADY